MIRHLLPTPMLSFLDLRLMVVEHLLAPLMHISREAYPAKGYLIHKPAALLTQLDCNFAYADTVRDFQAIEERLHTHPVPVCVFVADSLPALTEFSLRPLSLTSVSLELLFQYSTLPASYTLLPDRVRRSAQTMLEHEAGDLLLPKIHPLFYRIAKDRRDSTRSSVFAYLNGEAATFRHSGVPALDRLVESPLAAKTRRYAMHAAKVGLEQALLDHADADEFELRYLLSRRTIK